MTLSDDQQDRVIDGLAAGLGVEDIARAEDLPVAEVRALVDVLRANGLLVEVLRGEADDAAS